MTGSDGSTLRSILNRRLLFISGKGGVGKTTIACTLARLATNQGKRVLLVEIDAESRIGMFIGGSHLEKGTDPIELVPGLNAVNIDPHKAAQEIVKSKIKFGIIARRLVSSDFFNAFFQAAPGLKQLACLARVRRYMDENYDLVIVDAPATGHGLALLGAPKSAADALIGPLKKSAENLATLIKDAEQVALVIVTIPQEMPINEAIELNESAKEETGVSVAGIILNGVHPSPWETPNAQNAFEQFSTDTSLQNRLDKVLGHGASSALLLSGRMVTASAAMSQTAIETLANAGLKDRIDVPFIPAGIETEEGAAALYRVLERGILGDSGNGTG